MKRVAFVPFAPGARFGYAELAVVIVIPGVVVLSTPLIPVAPALPAFRIRSSRPKDSPGSMMPSPSSNSVVRSWTRFGAGGGGGPTATLSKNTFCCDEPPTRTRPSTQAL